MISNELSKHPFAPSGIRDRSGIEQCARCPLPEPNRIHQLPEVDEEQREYEQRRTGESE